LDPCDEQKPQNEKISIFFRVSSHSPRTPWLRITADSEWFLYLRSWNEESVEEKHYFPGHLQNRIPSLQCVNCVESWSFNSCQHLQISRLPEICQLSPVMWVCHQHLIASPAVHETKDRLPRKHDRYWCKSAISIHLLKINPLEWYDPGRCNPKCPRYFDGQQIKHRGTGETLPIEIVDSTHSTYKLISCKVLVMGDVNARKSSLARLRILKYWTGQIFRPSFELGRPFPYLFLRCSEGYILQLAHLMFDHWWYNP
jgi:hypothetical protein